MNVSCTWFECSVELRFVVSLEGYDVYDISLWKFLLETGIVKISMDLQFSKQDNLNCM